MRAPPPQLACGQRGRGRSSRRRRAQSQAAEARLTRACRGTRPRLPHVARAEAADLQARDSAAPGLAAGRRGTPRTRTGRSAGWRLPRPTPRSLPAERGSRTVGPAYAALPVDFPPLLAAEPLPSTRFPRARWPVGDLQPQLGQALTSAPPRALTKGPTRRPSLCCLPRPSGEAGQAAALRRL